MMRRQAKTKTKTTTRRPKPEREALSAMTLDEMDHAAREHRRSAAALAAFTGLMDAHIPREAARLAWDYADAFIEEDERRQRPLEPDAAVAPEAVP
jgi:hypothetical protein